MADNFVVSARKYRPITFDSVVGQSHITTTLKNAIRTNHLAQAFLFCGPRGVGKTTNARILAKTINCQNLTDEVEPCGNCESCLAFQNNASFNIHELDAASNNSVDDIRNLIDQVRYPPQTGKYKIYIIDEVHMLSTAAFNAFLKTLEEPPSYAIFILATTEKHKILPTILSRCQIFDFNRIQPSDIADHLAMIAKKEHIKVEREALELIAQKADGGLRDALSMFDLNVTFSTDNHVRYKDVLENLHILDYDYYFQITDKFLAGDISSSLLIFNEIVQKGFDGHQFVVGLLEHFRNLLVCQDPATIELAEVSDVAKNKYLEQATKATQSFLLSALSIGSQCDINYKAAKHQRLHVEICLMKIAKINEALDWAKLPDDEKKKPTPNPIVAPKVEPAVSTTAEPTVKYQNGANPVMSAGSRLKSTVNLSQPFAKLPATTDTPNQSSAEIQIYNFIDKPVDYEQLILAWRNFITKRLAETASKNEEVMLNRAIELNGTTISIELDNDLQTTILTDLKPDLINYLRQNLQNRTIQLVHRVVANDTKRNPYTPQERFNALAEKNPLLLNLQASLGLEVDF